jgi:ATP-dependent Clp protease adapter protein ClpS
MTRSNENEWAIYALGEEVAERSAEEIGELETVSDDTGNSGYRVILYNDDYHREDEVTSQLHKATGYTWPKCEAIMVEAHTRGRAICYRGERSKCHQVTRVLREIRLQCEVDCD